jgi:hypothetical protein
LKAIIAVDAMDDCLEAGFSLEGERIKSIHRQRIPKGNPVKLSNILIAALSLSAVTAYAEGADPAGQFAASVGQTSRTEVQAQLAGYKQAGVNPWSTSYNPLKSFKSDRSRAEVSAEYVGSRDAVAAMTGEDSGAAYLAARKATGEVRHLAGQPVRAH